MLKAKSALDFSRYFFEMDLSDVLRGTLVHLLRVSLAGRPQDVIATVRKSVPRIRKLDSDFADELVRLLATSPSANAPLRDVGGSMAPVDADSRLALVRHEFPVHLTSAPLFEAGMKERFSQVIAERREISKLQHRGLVPTRSLLFVGPPGVGKTMSARWIAAELGLPLMVLDLATVMSSFLGKTGSNLRAVLEYAKGIPSVLLLDEFDAIAKRRGDDADIGELKRLVNVLLQEIDDWPPNSILIAATNHGELLDPAIWRRFDDVIYFNRPGKELRTQLIERTLEDDADLVPWSSLLADLWRDMSHSDIARTVRAVRRKAAINDGAIVESLLERVAPQLREGSAEQRMMATQLLEHMGYSDRRISSLIGISRDTIRIGRSKLSHSGANEGVDNAGAALPDRPRRKAVRRNKQTGSRSP